MKNPYMKFQNPSVHGSEVTDGSEINLTSSELDLHKTWDRCAHYFALILRHMCTILWEPSVLDGFELEIEIELELELPSDLKWYEQGSSLLVFQFTVHACI